tara:strand:- start:550 stop:1035 length:486 start_codon:yes stop_codon:yes gene_type:complete
MIDVYDNVLENHEAQFVHHLLTDQEFMWQYQHRSDNTKPIYHWHRHAGKNDSDLQSNNFEWLIPIWSNFINKYDFKEKYGVNTYRRIYFNAHTHGIEPQPHKDDGDFTMIYYPIMNWKKTWGGGTVIWDENGEEIEKHVEYVGNRLFVFPGQKITSSNACV